MEGLLKVLMVKIQYCSDYNFEDETEYEAEWQELRRLLMKTFRKVFQHLRITQVHQINELQVN